MSTADLFGSDSESDEDFDAGEDKEDDGSPQGTPAYQSEGESSDEDQTEERPNDANELRNTVADEAEEDENEETGLLQGEAEESDAEETSLEKRRDSAQSDEVDDVDLDVKNMVMTLDLVVGSFHQILQYVSLNLKLKTLSRTVDI